MAHCVDLAPCKALGIDCDALLAVGWLAWGAEFPLGTVSPAFFAALKRLCANPWQPVVAAGVHVCELCQFDAPRFGANVFVPHAGRIYVAPVAVTHYIAAHRYQPPEIFIEAVLACPPMQSLAYKRALLECGGRRLAAGGADRQT